MIKKPVRELVIIFLPLSVASLSAAPANIVKPPATSMPKRMRPEIVRRVGRKELIILPRLLPVVRPKSLFNAS